MSCAPRPGHPDFAGRQKYSASDLRDGDLEAGVNNGKDVIVVAYMKPLSTLAKGLVATGEPARSAYKRSDVAAVAACGVIAEAMLAFVLADALLESQAATALRT